MARSMDRRGLIPCRRIRLLLGLAAAALLAAAPAGASAAERTLNMEKSKTVRIAGDDSSAAAAAKKKKGKPAFKSASSQVGFLSGTSATTNATCPGKTHATGGGYAVSPIFANPAGLRSINVTSNLVDDKTWGAAGSAFTTPGAAGTFTTHVRCESNALGRIAIRASSSLVLNPGSVQNMTISCPRNTHVISGGFTGTGPVDLTSPATGTRILIFQSRRTGVGQWTVTGANNPNANAAALLTGYATCERDAKGTSISEVSASTPLFNDLRAGVTARCTGKKHAVSGGFVITPNGVGPAVFSAIDENLPIGKKGWRVGLYEFPEFSLPAGSSLAGYAYCKKDAVKTGSP